MPIDETASEGTAVGEPRTDTDGMAAVQSSDRPDWNAPSSSTPDTTASPVVAEQSTEAVVSHAAPVDVPPASETATAQTGWQSIREAATALGYQGAAQFTDDQQLLAHLLRQQELAQRTDYFSRLGQQLVPHAGRIQQLLQTPQPGAQPQRAAWTPPEWNDRWALLVEQDPSSGVYISKPGVDPSVGQKVNEYVTWQEQFRRDPAQYIQPMVEQKARELARSEFQTLFAERETRAAVEHIHQANQDWLYQKTPDGQAFARNYRNELQFTPAGARYFQLVQDLDRSGVKDARTQDRFARQLLAAEVAQVAPATTAGRGQQLHLATGRTNQNPLQALPSQSRQVAPGATEPITEGKPLGEILRESLIANGVTDDDVARSIESQAVA